MQADKADPQAFQWRFDQIRSHKLADARMALREAVGAQTLDRNGLKEVLKKIYAATPAAEQAALREQVAIINDALDGKAIDYKKTPFETDAQRLAWSAALQHVAQEEQHYGEVEDHIIWNRMRDSQWAQTQLMQHHTHLYFSSKDPNTRVGWGTPGTGFYHRQETHYINLDLGQAMAEPDYLHIFFHEEAHRLFTAEYPEILQADIRKLKALEEKAQRRPLSEAEDTEAMKANIRYELNHGVWNGLEDNMTDEYAQRRYQQHNLPDPAGALLRIMFFTAGLGQLTEPPAGLPPLSEARKKYENIHNAVLACRAMQDRYQFLPNTSDGWEKLGIKPGLMEAEGLRPGDPKVTGMDAIKLLKRYAKAIAEAQPDPACYNDKGEMERQTRHFQNRRNELIEEMMRRFVTPLMDRLVEEEMQKDQEEEQNQQQDGGKDQKQAGGQPGKDGGPPPQGGQPGQPGQDRPGGKAGGNPQGAPQGGAGKGGEGKPANGPQAKPRPKVKIVSGDNTPTPKPGQKIIRVPASSPAEERKQGQGKGDSEENSQMLSDLDSDAGQPQGRLPQPRRSPRVPFDPGNAVIMGLGDRQNRDAMEEQGDSARYHNLVGEYCHDIPELARMLLAIQKAQREKVMRQAQVRDIVPYNAHEMDQPGYVRQQVAEAMGNAMPADHKIFYKPGESVRPPQLTIVGQLDASGSMDSVQRQMAGFGATLNEAVRDANAKLSAAVPSIEFHMNVWGAAKAIPIVKPGDSPEAIGRRIQAIEDGETHSSSALAPSIRSYLEEALKAPVKGNMEGSTHMFIVTDGGVSDQENSFKALEAALSCEKIHVDIIKVKISNGEHYAEYNKAIDLVVGRLKAGPHAHKINMIEVNAADLTSGLKQSLIGALAQTSGQDAIPTVTARKQIREALQRISPDQPLSPLRNAP